jgi:hypothetical protein
LSLKSTHSQIWKNSPTRGEARRAGVGELVAGESQHAHAVGRVAKQRVHETSGVVVAQIAIGNVDFLGASGDQTQT